VGDADRARHRADSIGPTLRGLWGFPLTPFTAGGVNVDLLAKQALFQLDGGVDVLCACGSIAQGDQLSPGERLECLNSVVSVAAARVPVVLAVPVDEAAVASVVAAGRAGATAVLLLPGSERVAELARLLAELACSAPDVPVVLYHRPPLLLRPPELTELAATSGLAGVKDGYRDVRLCRRLRGAVGGEQLLWLSSWEDVALPFFALGFDGFAPASAAYAPAYARSWYERLAAGDLAAADRLLAAHAYPMADLRTSRPGIEISVVKAAMEMCGLDGGETRPPALPLTTEERDQVRALTASLAELLDGRCGR